MISSAIAFVSVLAFLSVIPEGNLLFFHSAKGTQR
jgi:hypothetical protein